MTSNKSTLKKPTLDELVFGALSQLQTLHYNDRSIRRYQATWKRLISFAKKHGFKNRFSQKLIFEFLKYHNISSELPVRLYKDWRLHAEFSLRILQDYASHGYFERYKILLSRLDIPDSMLKSLDEYKKYCEEKRYLSSYTLKQSVKQVGLFLDFLGKRNVIVFKLIKAEDLLDFVYSLSRLSPRTISGTISYVRLFLRFLFSQGKLKTDLSKAFPTSFIKGRVK